MSSMATLMKVVRVYRDISQDAVRQRLGCSQQTYSTAERGGKVSRALLVRIKQVLGWTGSADVLQTQWDGDAIKEYVTPRTPAQ